MVGITSPGTGGAAATPSGSLSTVFTTDQTVVTRGGTSYTATVAAVLGAASLPAAPTVTLTPSSGQISIAWIDGSANGSAITAHKLYRGTTAGGEALIGTITTGSPYLDTGLTNGTTYYYKVSAVNAVGEGALSAEVSSAPLLPARNIASNARVGGNATGALSNGTDTTMNSTTAHFNESGVALTFLQPVYNGWYMNTVSEAICPNNYTVTAAIEYPAGTRTQVKWSGATSGIVVAGTDLVSDQIAVAIPAGAQFWFHTFASAPSGSKWPVCSNVWTGLGEASESGTGLSDKTMSGTITNTGANCLRPAAILSSASGMHKVCLAVMGDSIIAGSGDGNPDTHGNTGWAARSATGICPVVSLAVSGTKAGDQAATNGMRYRLSFLQTIGVTHAMTDYGVNDFGTGASAATIEGYQQTIWNNLSGIGLKPVQSTITPESTSTDNWLTTANQSVPAGSGFSGGTSSTRAAVNTNIRTVPSPLFAIVETADKVETSRSSGIWGAGAAFNSTRLLPTDAGVVGSGSTTTTVTSNITRGANYYNYGGAIEFTSGVLNGTVAYVSSSTSGGTFTVPAMSAAPAAGDTFNAIPHGAAPTNDGTHPSGNGNGIGGLYEMMDVLVPLLTSWNS